MATVGKVTMRITFRRRFCLPGLGIIILKECFGSNFKAFSVAGKSDLTAALKPSVHLADWD